MKIWYQTASAYRYEPIWDEYGRTIEEQCSKVLRPDTEVHVTGVPVLIIEMVKYKSILFYHEAQILNNMLKAEREGYDAFAIGCTYDSGLAQGREMLSIPVVGISQTAYHFASLLGELFAVVSTQPYMSEFYRQQVRAYGLSEKFLPGPYFFTATEEELAVAFSNPGPIVEKFIRVAEKAIADGASVIIAHPGLMSPMLYKAGLTKVGDVAVLDTVSIVVKTAEMLAELRSAGVEVSRKLGVYGSPGKQLLKEALQKYATVFKIAY
jgi:allantoin racemase